jgi:hypothetical protein
MPVEADLVVDLGSAAQVAEYEALRGSEEALADANDGLTLIAPDNVSDRSLALCCRGEGYLGLGRTKTLSLMRTALLNSI